MLFKVPSNLHLMHRSFCGAKSIVKESFKDAQSLILFNKLETRQLIGNSFLVQEDFITPEEEERLIKEIDPLLKRYKYDDTHIDHAIKQYKEIERSKWTSPNQVIIDRIRTAVFSSGEKILDPVHVLDLSPNGFIKPHLDSVRFCGPTIGGVSLLSDCVMRFIHEKDQSLVMDVWLKRRSLYIMKDTARYLFKHEILGSENSMFGNTVVPRSRRVSIICRCLP
ncbi:alpha-ketoglutarate-dependent dioxygenase alkB homolog 7, mitochondrial [Tetranychus urticae]|uniref:Alpha-ketoglutarate-dependent dioxygenase AlkB-like domain-containing protein n=1 Tax=Tetranychus urticae TaxID=32264 RepID=T1K891_TETUR|nr:alpha-ketoglutarate-dependent dioxygenase alkB homolog 7, mitochondrial [Tetranychus urticae]